MTTSGALVAQCLVFTHWSQEQNLKVHLLRVCTCRVEKAQKLRDIFSLLLGDSSAAETPCSKILFCYSLSKHVHEEIWSSSVGTINKLPSVNTSRYLHFPNAEAVTNKDSGSSGH